LTALVLGAALVGETVALLARLDGPRLLDPSGKVLAELAADGDWYTPGGVRCTGVRCAGPPGRDKATLRTDAEWITATAAVIRTLAARNEQLTSDDVWEAIHAQPRESRMMGNALSRAQHAKVIARTKQHRPSRRKENHGRPILIWRSLIHGQQNLLPG